MRHVRVCLLAASLPIVVSACGSGAKPATLAAPSGAGTTTPLAGDRCQGTQCTCRPVGEQVAETTPPAPGTKRFEIRLATTTGVAWATAFGGQLYKSAERAEDCFYVDLPAGEHPVSLRAKADPPEGGVGLSARIYEYRPASDKARAAWYETFLLPCGVPGPCARESLQDWKQQAEADRSTLHDPCSMTKIMSLGWETGRMPDALHPEDLTVSFVLKVLAHEPAYAPRDPGCPTK